MASNKVNRLKNIIIMLLGWLFVALALLGILLPLLPTTPFLLIASACFVQASTRCANWLHQHPVLGPSIKHWQQHKAISRKNKRRGMSLMLISFALSCYFLPQLWQKILLLVLGSLLLTWFYRLTEIEINHTHHT